MTSLPQGIYLESERGRYRVRLYYRQRVIWRTYHPTLEAARSALQDAHHYRQDYARTAPARIRSLPTSAVDLLR